MKEIVLDITKLSILFDILGLENIDSIKIGSSVWKFYDRKRMFCVSKDDDPEKAYAVVCSDFVADEFRVSHRIYLVSTADKIILPAGAKYLIRCMPNLKTPVTISFEMDKNKPLLPWTRTDENDTEKPSRRSLFSQFQKA